MAKLDETTFLSLTNLTTYDGLLKGWVNDKFFVGTKEDVIAEFNNIKEDTLIYVTDDVIDLSQLSKQDISEEDVEEMFDENLFD